ncbi:putative metallophosphoesterase [Zea mays]|uniref:Putative metallophosphoesterase n=2 Tax=Zea mays TaxID=4577 RepID=A0A8J8YCY9_MAIZE|nr:Putative metallophosphoesterase [Zea mays]PWZ33623.1 putative metallophosphoesterase [Zea mays]
MRVGGLPDWGVGRDDQTNPESQSRSAPGGPRLAACAFAMESRGKRILPFLLVIIAAAAAPSAMPRDEREVVVVSGAPDGVVWVAQLSDLHFSVHHPERAYDFRRYVGPALAMVNPDLVLITGDLTDGKSKDLLTMKQNEVEWVEYESTMKEIIENSKLPRRIFYDMRGNHDSFGVPASGEDYDFYSKYSINAKLRRQGRVQSITLENSGRKHLFVGFDSTMEIGLRGPTNLFGHPTDKQMIELDQALSQWNTDFDKVPVTKIAFGHFPLSFSALTESGKSIKDVFLKQSLAAYLCGHLHTRFGKNLKRYYHRAVQEPSLSEHYYQHNMHQGDAFQGNKENCSEEASHVEEFWEWEMGDWRKSRSMRILAIDDGYVSYTDIDFRLGSKSIIILPTFPLDSRFMQRASAFRDFKCHVMGASSFDTVRALVFSKHEIVSVSVKIYDSRPGTLEIVFDSEMKRVDSNETRGNMYLIPWNWRAFEDSSPSRYWLQIEVMDITGDTSVSQLRPFSVNGLLARVNWTWKEFFVIVPTIVILAAMAAERTAYREHYLSRSGKKKDDYPLQSAREGLCYEPLAPCASTFLLRSFTHGVCHLQDTVHLAVREF